MFDMKMSHYMTPAAVAIRAIDGATYGLVI